MDGGDGEAPWTPIEITDGEWAGWRVWSNDPFEILSGPFYCRQGENGTMICAFRAEKKHMNNSGAVHGGCLLTFADYALFCFGAEAIEGSGSVTASLNAEFIDAARLGEIVEASGEVIRAGRSLVFLRGLIATGGRTLMTFSAIVKKVRRG